MGVGFWVRQNRNLEDVSMGDDDSRLLLPPGVRLADGGSIDGRMGDLSLGGRTQRDRLCRLLGPSLSSSSAALQGNCRTLPACAT